MSVTTVEIFRRRGDWYFNLNSMPVPRLFADGKRSLSDITREAAIIWPADKNYAVNIQDEER